MNKIYPIKAFQDNYIWAIHSLEGNEILVVDPGDADPVLAYLDKNKLSLRAILLTHHHWDHSGGITALRKHFPEVPAYGSANEKAEGITHRIKENDEIAFEEFGLTFTVLDIPGHTLGHIAFVTPHYLFCGDTLFSCGCGKIFEGTPSQMYHSLEKIKNLPDKTFIFCGHEYTLSNIIFAQKVDPENHFLTQKLHFAQKCKHKNAPTLPASLALEKVCNPFLRCDDKRIIQAVEKHWGMHFSDPISVFAHLRQWKNQVA